MTLGISPSEIVGKGTYQLLRKAPHWERIPLSQVAEVQNGFAFKSAFFDRERGVPLIRIRDIQGFHTEHRYFGEYDERYKVRTGDILVGMDGDFMVARWKGDEGLLNQRVCRIQNQSNLFDGGFLFLCLQPYLNAINAETSSVTVKHLSSKTIETIPLPLPPLNEQHRIVAKIEELFSELDKVVESLRATKSTLALYRESLLKTTFEGRLTADWRARNTDKMENPDLLLARVREERVARYKAAVHEWECAVAAWKKGGQKGRRPAKPKQYEEFGLLSTSERLPWPRARVQSLLDAPLTNGRSVKDKPGGFPVLRLTALKNGGIDFRESKEGDWSQDDAKPFCVERDDIFIARGSGSKKLVGVASLVLDDPEPVAFPDTMIRARLDTSAVRPEYFVLAWNSRAVRRQIEKAARTTAGIYKINQGHVCGFVLPLPSLAEQAKIVRFLDDRLKASEELEMEVDASIARAEILRQSILKKAFAGELVPHDPNDEPASTLLARIQAERAEAPAMKRTT